MISGFELEMSVSLMIYPIRIDLKSQQCVIICMSMQLIRKMAKYQNAKQGTYLVDLILLPRSRLLTFICCQVK